MPWLNPVSLQGDIVSVVPLDQSHCDDLKEASC